MGKKKTNKINKVPKSTERKSFGEVLGINKIFDNEKTNFLGGFVLVVMAIFLIIAFSSYITTGADDQSLLEDPRPGEWENTDRVFHNYCNSIGAYLAYFFMKRCFGFSAYIIPAFLILAGLKSMSIYMVNLWKWFFCLTIVMVWSSVTLAQFLTPLLDDYFFNPGGDHGLFICQYLYNIIGSPGLLGVLIITMIAFLTYLTNETINVIRKAMNPMKYWGDKIPFFVTNSNSDENTTETQPQSEEEDNDEDVEEEPQSNVIDLGSDLGENDEPEIKDPAADAFTVGTGTGEGTEEQDMVVVAGATEEKADSKVVGSFDNDDALYDPKKTLSKYQYPTLDLLKDYRDSGKLQIDMDEQQANKNRIVEVLRQFGVGIKTIKATVGPTVTLYEIQQEDGVRISKIRKLGEDICQCLAATGVRIIAPIPGKSTIGIEVPNTKPQIVSMHSILNSKKFQETDMALPIALGKTITNEVYMVDLAKIPHLLVAGATGQGKSVGLNAIITSLLYKKHPAELKFVMVDPKKVEFSVYRKLENYFLAEIESTDEDDEPIITDVQKVVKTLNSLCKEMDTRYDLLKLAGTRNIKEYNERFKARSLNPDHGHHFMPYIVVIIDEFGDLIMTAGKEVELPIARIAQLARAVGIHMVIATQRPTTNIITGTIKANFPGRMAFKVAAMIDSRTILDRPGADQLIGRGDMLMLSGAEPVRVQCAFVDTPEVEQVNEFISNQSEKRPIEQFYLPEPDMGDADGGSKDVDMTHMDPLFEEAARMIVSMQMGSTSNIQRKFSIGYNRAGRLMDQLEKAGIVGQAHGSKPREVLIVDEASLDAIFQRFRS